MVINNIVRNSLDQQYQRNTNYTVRGMSLCTSTVYFLLLLLLFFFSFYICPRQEQGGSSIAMPFELLSRTIPRGLAEG